VEGREARESAAPGSATLVPEPFERNRLDRPDVIMPLAPGRYLFRFTASAQTREKLRRAQDLLRHSVPSGDVGAIVGRGLDLLLEKLLREKAALTKRSRTAGGRSGATTESRYIPAAVRRAVWLRDDGRCAFVSPDGRRCAARSLLEFHHRTPFGIGGAAVASNIELRCRPHNAYEAALFYGPPRELAPGRVEAGTLKAEAAADLSSAGSSP
jgi:hypothetical protein